MGNQNAITLDVQEQAFTLTRMFDAPVAMVYKAWTDAEQFSRWWGPHTFTNPQCEIDLRVGGKFLVVMTSPEGEANPLRGEFLEIVPNEKIVLRMFTDDHTQAWHQIVNAARGVAPDAKPANLLTTIRFEAENGKTKLTVTQSFDNNVDRDAFLQLGSVIGWGQSFAKMESLLATLATEREFIHLRTLNAPLELVWKVWSDPKHLEKWWGPNGFRNTITHHELKAGGEWIYTMHGPDGTDYPNWMRFDVVEPLTRIAYTHGAMPDDPNAFKGEITFSDAGDNKTAVKLRVTLASGELRDGMFKYSVFEGGDQTLSRWDAYLSNL